MRGLSGVNIPNLPGFNQYAKLLGDYSSLRSGNLALRAIRGRTVGRVAGLIFGGVKARFGVWGLVATAEFFAFLRDLLRYHKAQGGVWLGSMATYARPIDVGFTTKDGRSVAAAPYFSNAMIQAHQDMSRRGRRGSAGKGLTAVRSGLYEGQKFVGDLGAFARGDLSRVVRRSAGQEVAGFFWGTLRITKTGIKGPPNILALHAQNVISHARDNLKKYGKVKTGILQQSLAWGGTQDEFMFSSIERATRRALQRGVYSQIGHRIADPASVPRVEPVRTA